MQMTFSNADRVLGAVFASLLSILTYAMIVNFSFSLHWFFLLIWVAVLFAWGVNGLRDIEIGWVGELTFLGGRIKIFFQEGKRWLPFPFNTKQEDCRKQILNLGNLEGTSKDNVKMIVSGTAISYRVINLHEYLDVEKKDIEKGLDVARSEAIRVWLRSKTQAEALDLHEDLGKDVKPKIEHQEWGIDILEVLVPEVISTLAEQLALKVKEELEAVGQFKEAEFFARLMDIYQKPISDGGAGLSQEQAFEQAQITIGKNTKTTDAKVLTLDARFAEVLATAFGRK